MADTIHDAFIDQLKDLLNTLEGGGGVHSKSPSQQEVYDLFKREQGSWEGKSSNLYYSLHQSKFLASILAKQMRWYRQLRAFPDRFCILSFINDELRMIKREHSDLVKIFQQQEAILKQEASQLNLSLLLDMLYERRDKLQCQKEPKDEEKEYRNLKRLCNQYLAAHRSNLHSYKRIQQDVLQDMTERLLVRFDESFQQINDDLLACLEEEALQMHKLEVSSKRLANNLLKQWSQLKEEMVNKFKGWTLVGRLLSLVDEYLNESSSSSTAPQTTGTVTRLQGQLEGSLISVDSLVERIAKGFPEMPHHLCRQPSLRVEMGRNIQHLYKAILQLQNQWQMGLQSIEGEVLQHEKALERLAKTATHNLPKQELEDLYQGLQRAQNEQQLFQDQEFSFLKSFERLLAAEKQWVEEMDDFYESQIQCVRQGLHKQKLLYDQIISQYQQRSQRAIKEQKRTLQITEDELEQLYQKEKARLMPKDDPDLLHLDSCCQMEVDIVLVKLLDDFQVRSKRLVEEIRLSMDFMQSTLYA